MNSQIPTKQSSRLRRVLSDTLIVLGISIALVLLGEVFLKLFFPQNLLGTKITGETFSERDEVLGIRYTPGARWRFTHPEYAAEYAINTDGFRDTKAHPIPKPAGTIRVLILGDSFTFGQGVNYDHTWPVMAEKKLAAWGYTHIDLVKAGIQGMDTRSEFILMQRLLEKYQSDVVVVGFLINDLYTNTLYGIEANGEKAVTHNAEQRIVENQSAAAESWFNMARQVFIRNDREKTFHLLTLAKRTAIASGAVYCRLYFTASNGDFLTIPLPPGPEKQLKITKVLFEKMAAYAQASGKKFLVLSIPQQSQVLCFEQSENSPIIDAAFYDRYFSDLATQHGFTWVTTLDAFQRSNHGQDKLFYRLDGHLTPAGNQIVAEVFVQKIVSLINETANQQ